MDRSRAFHERVRHGSIAGSVADRLAAVASRWRWLVPGVIAGILVSIVYLQSHPYPAFGAGLYLEMSEQVLEHPLDLPAVIGRYTDRGVPFAYPPLMVYVNAVLVSGLGIDPIAYTRYVPNLVSILALVPSYLLAEAVLETRRGAGLATLFAAVTPPLLQWHISAGGIVRTPAYLFALAGLYAGVRLFRSGERRWLAHAILWVTLTALTHPIYTAFVCVSYLWLWVVLDRTTIGLGRGATVAAAGGVLTSPWWVTVVAEHGAGVFAGASATHGGLGHGLISLLALVSGTPGGSEPAQMALGPGLFHVETTGTLLLLGWTAVIVVAWANLLFGEGRLLLAGWLVVAVAVFSNPRFPYLIGTFVVAAALSRFVLRPIDGSSLRARGRTAIGAILVVVVVVSALATGVAYAGSHVDTHAGSQSLPQFVDRENRAAMDWVEGNTEPTAEFAVLGDVAEWFPYFTNRTILVGSWGVEWRGQAAFDRQRSRFDRLSTCLNASCVTRVLEGLDTPPDYVQVPRTTYTVRGMERRMPPSMHATLAASPRYTLVHRNGGVTIYAYDGSEGTDAAATAPTHVDGDVSGVREAGTPERSR